MSLLNSVAAQGRGGDTRLAHVTPGEVVIPREVAAVRPDLVNAVGSQVRRMGGHPGLLKVGQGKVNPATGIEEFATQQEVIDMYQSTLGRAPESQAVIDAWANYDGFSKDTFLNAAAPEIASHVNDAYQANFGRDAEAGGLKHWQDLANAKTYGSVADLNSTIRASAIGQDVYARDDGAKYDTAWRSDLDPNSGNLVYDATKDQWNPSVKKTLTAAATAPSIATYTPTVQAVDQSGLVKNQMAGLLNSDSSYMQSARTRAQQAGQASGLLNSSLAATSGEKAASDAALSIATPDATAVNTQSLKNQDALNTAGQFNANWANDFSKLSLQQQYALQSAGYSAELQAGLNSQSQSATASLAAQQQAATKKAADSAQAQTIYTSMNTLKTEASKYVTSIMADTTLDDAAKAATIKSYLATATATQAGYNAQLAVLNYAPGAYFDFSTLSGH